MLPLENGGIIVLAYVEGTLPSGIYPPQMMKHLKKWNACSNKHFSF
jgi:hypothetical protein